MKRFCKHYFWSILAVAVVFILSVIPIPEVKPIQQVPFYDKWIHIVMYLGIALTVFYDMHRHSPALAAPPAPRWQWVFTLLMPILLGGGLELWQAYLTTCRSGDVQDFLADALGALIAQPIGRYAVKPWAQRLNFWPKL